MIVKKNKKPFKFVVSLSMLLGMSSASFAEIIIHSSAGESGQANMVWSSEQANSFLNGDEPSPQGSTNVTTTLRATNTTTVPNKPVVVSNVPKATVTTSTRSVDNITTLLEPKKTTQIYDTYHLSNQPYVNARAALVMDANTGEVLYSKNTNLALPIASVTKLMTSVVIADARLNMSENITLLPIDFAGAGGKNSSSTLRVGDQMNRAEALLFALMKSENPAAAALGRTYPGGQAAFVAAMNSKARELGMNTARFTEATGLDPRNVASARDLGILVTTASQYGLIRQFSTTPSYDFNLGYRVLKSNNTNGLVRNGGWNINLSKTGFINEAGRCVVMHSTVNNRPVAVVVLGATNTTTRNNDATNLMNWAGNLPKRI